MRPLILPWPDRALHPNTRCHWSKRAKAAKSARDGGHLLTLQAGWHQMPLPEGRLHLWLDFYPPDRRKRDDDGCLSSFKPWRDGIADALGIDDNRFVSHPFVKDEVRKGGQVVVRITASPSSTQRDGFEG